MMCQSSGRPPISTMGLGRTAVSSAMRVPLPPARMTTLGRCPGRWGEKVVSLIVQGVG